MNALRSTPGLSSPSSGLPAQIRNAASPASRLAAKERPQTSAFRSELNAYSRPEDEDSSESSTSTSTAAPRKQTAGTDVPALINSPSSQPSQTQTASKQVQIADLLTVTAAPLKSGPPENDLPRNGAGTPIEPSPRTTATASAPTNPKLARKPADTSPADQGDGTGIASLMTLPTAADAPSAMQDANGPLDRQDKEAPKLSTGGAHQVQETESADAPNGPSGVTGDLALAMRITAANADPAALQSKASLSTEQVTGSPGLSNSARSGTLTITGTPDLHHEPNNAPGAAPVLAGNTQSASETSKASATDEVTSSRATDFEAELDKFRSEPVRSVHVQVAGENNQQVDIRMFERAGELSVTVRSGDAGLTRALQDHAPELGTSLALEHFRSELWTPPSGGHGNSHDSSSGGSASHSGSNPERQSSGQRQSGQQHQQTGQQSKWIEELEKTPIASQKRIEYTWQQ